MKTYTPLTLGELINKLDALGSAKVRGLDGEVKSYRGYYERNAIAPCHQVVSAAALVHLYRRELGKGITGYKGGNFIVQAGETVYCAGYGDTGPAICGLEVGEDGVYEPVLVNETW